MCFINKCIIIKFSSSNRFYKYNHQSLKTNKYKNVLNQFYHKKIKYNHLSSQLIEHDKKRTKTYDVGNPGPGLGQA
jgi:hypothetical protein